MDKKYLVVKKRKELNKFVLPAFDIKIGTEDVKIENSTGRYAAENIYASFDIPNFKKSLVDGFAVHSGDVRGASPSNPVPLKLKATLKIGESYGDTLKKGETVFVPTGGVVPKEADAVVMIEFCEIQGNEVFIYRDIAKNENLIKAGDDIKKGAQILKIGEKITSEKIASLRAFGIKKLSVYRKIRIGIISTGDELVDSGKAEFGKIYDINGYTIFAESTKWNFIPRYYGIIRDDKNLIKEALKKALSENDIVVMSGGTSKGSFDYTVSAIEELKNGKVLIHGLHLSPGKPTVIGVSERKLIAGLSGNPLASFLVFKKVIIPLVFEKCNLIYETREIFAEITENVPSRKGREEFIIGKLTLKNGKNTVKPLFSESAFSGILAKGDGFIVVPLMSEGIKKGEKVKFELW